MKNIIYLSKFQLKTTKKQWLGWTIAVFGILFLYMILFPSVKEMGQIKLDAMPKELLQVIGVEKMTDLSDYTTYFGMVYQFVLVAISIFAVTYGAGNLSKEEKNKSIEFLYALKVSRSQIFISKCVCSLITLLIIICLGAIATLLCGVINGGDTFNVANIISIVSTSSVTAIFFMSVGLMISGISSKLSGASLAGFLISLSYILGYIAELGGEKLAFLSYFSPFYLFNGTNVLAMEFNTFVALKVYFALIILFIYIGLTFYKKRDLK